MQQLLPCYLENSNCELFLAALPPGSKLFDQILSMHVSVSVRLEIDVAYLTKQAFALLTGELMPKLDLNACTEKHLAWMAGFDFKGVCVNYTVNSSLAYSPAFIINGMC